MRSTAAAVAVAVLLPLLGACGSGQTHGDCTTSPPDVVAITAVPLGGGVEPSQDERAAENRYAAAHADVYAGAIFGNGHMYIGFTVAAGAHLDELRRSVPDPARVRAFCADHTVSELTAVQERIEHDMSDLRNQGVDITTVGLDERTSRVDVTVAHLDTRIEALLRDRYGSTVVRVTQGIAVDN